MSPGIRITGLLIALGMLVLISCHPVALLGTANLGREQVTASESEIPTQEGMERETGESSQRTGKLSAQQARVNVGLVSPAEHSKIRNNILINVSVGPVNQLSRVRWEWGLATYNLSNDNVPASDYVDGFIDVPVPTVEEVMTLTLVVWAYDLLGSYSWDQWQFFVDSTTVLIILVSPEEGQYYHSGTEITVEFEPEPLGFLYAWDGGTYSAGSSFLVTPLPIGAGLHELSVKAEHAATGAWSTAEWSFYTDDTAAMVTITSPVNGSTIRSGTRVIWTADSDLVDSYFSWDGGSNQTEPETVPGAIGLHSLDIVTVDRANNTARYYYEFYVKIGINLEYPLNVSSPVIPGIITDDASLGLDGYGYIKPDTLPVVKFSDTPVEVYYNWRDNSTDPGTNSTSLSPSPSSEGVSKYFEIFAKGSDNKWDHFIVNLTTDSTSPSINQLNYLNNSKLLANTITGLIASESLLYEYYSWDGADNDTDYRLPASIGSHELDIWLADHAENWYHVKYVYYTKYAVYLDPADGITNGSTLNPGVTINITITPDPVSAYYSWDFSPPSTSIPVQPQESAWHVLNVTCLDGEGTPYTTIYTFLTRLVVTVVSPPENESLLPRTPVSLSFSDTPHGVLYRWETDANPSFALKPLPINDGFHYLTVEVENDDAVNGREWFTQTFTFITDGTAPIITETSHENGSTINSGTLLRFYTDAETVATVKYSWNSGPPNDGVIGIQEVALLPPASDGLHNLTLNLTDGAGNLGHYSFNYTVDDTPVTVSLVSLFNGSTVLAGTVVNISFDEPPVTVYYNWDNSSPSSTADSIPWGNGTHTLMVRTSDGLNWNTTIFVFTVIDPLVTITVNAPLSDHRNTTKNLKSVFNVTFSEETLGIWYSWNGSEPETFFNASRPDGRYELNITAQESSGANNSLVFILEIDNSGPMVVATVPDILNQVAGNYVIDLKDYKKIVFYLDETTQWAPYYFNKTGCKSNHLEGPGTVVEVRLPDMIGVLFLEISFIDDLGNKVDYSYWIEVEYAPARNTPGDVLVYFIVAAIITGFICAIEYRKVIAKKFTSIMEKLKSR
ncbi:MAG: hypothetical protein ACFFD4_18880 [Candidatus Odinarchaeota archaeon]